MDRLKGTLAVVAAAEALIIIDISFGAMVIDDVQREFDSSIAAVQGVLAGYALIVAVLTLLGGRLAGRWSSPVTLRIGLLIRAVGAAVTATAFDMRSYGLGEAVLAGIGMALVSPSTTATVGALFRGRASARAFGVIGASIAIAGGLGPVVGGWITTNLSWRWCNWFEFVISLALLAASVVIPRIARSLDGSRIDWLGFVTSTVAFAAIVIGLEKMIDWGWWSARHSDIAVLGLSPSPILIAAGLGLLAVFLRIEQRRSARGLPVLVDPMLLRRSGLRAALATTLTSQAALAGLLVVVPVYLQVVQGRSAFASGLFLLPMSVTGFLAATLLPRLSRRYTARTLTSFAALCMIICSALAYWEVDPAIWGAPLLLGIAVFGFGSGIFDSALDAVAQGSVDAGREHEAAGLQCTADNFGSAIGITLVTAVMIMTLSANVDDFLHRHPTIATVIEQVDPDRLSHDVPMVDDAAIERYGEGLGAPPDQVETMTDGYQRSQTDALELALLATGGLSMLALIATRRIPRRHLEEMEEVGITA